MIVNKGFGVAELKDFNRPLQSVNNNIVVKCKSKHPSWIEVQCSIQNINDYEQALYAYPKAVKIYPTSDKVL